MTNPARKSSSKKAATQAAKESKPETPVVATLPAPQDTPAPVNVDQKATQEAAAFDAAKSDAKATQTVSNAQGKAVAAGAEVKEAEAALEEQKSQAAEAAFMREMQALPARLASAGLVLIDDPSSNIRRYLGKKPDTGEVLTNRGTSTRTLIVSDPATNPPVAGTPVLLDGEDGFVVPEGVTSWEALINPTTNEPVVPAKASEEYIAAQRKMRGL